MLTILDLFCRKFSILTHQKYSLSELRENKHVMLNTSRSEREREREEGTEKVTEHKNPRLLLAHLKTLPKSKSRILKRERERERERAASIKDGSVGKVDEVGSG
jgi:hypothetical protein